MPLIHLEDISIEYGDNPILINAGLVIETNERICLVGRNGAGKSTLMNIVSGEVEADSGVIHRRQHLRISKLEQTLPDAVETSVFDTVREGLADQVALIDRYQALASGDPQQSDTLSDKALLQQMNQMEELQAGIEAGGGWNVDKQVEAIISQLGLPSEKRLSELSGGWRRRVALGKALVSKPELLLLDEPTNHLDIATIEWLEHTVRGYRGSVVFITHDRDFLQKIATRIVEIDRGKLVSWPGSYQQFLKLKELALKEEETQNALFDKRLAEEESWIRQGVKARRTRNEGRVRALKAMRDERAQRINKQGKAKIHVETSDQSGRKVCEARNVSHGYNNETLINNFKLKIMRGDRIGLIGNNGVGKSTLLKIILGMIEPDQGSVKLGTNLTLGYFDQVKRELNPDKSIADNVGMGRDFISINGKDRHIIGYLQNFLFAPKRCMTPIKALSGGERNRVSLAKLFTKASNLLVLDEPTNDLDIEMLEVLEEKLVEYDGTLLIVSHDREFLDNVVTSILVFEEDGSIQEYVGGYSDWAQRGKKLRISDGAELIDSQESNDSSKPNNSLEHTNSTEPSSNAGINEKQKPNNSSSPTKAQTNKTSKKNVKLSYQLQRELDGLPAAIELLEIEIEEQQKIIEKPEFYDRSFDDTQPILQSLGEAQQRLEHLTNRWIELEEIQAGS